MEPITKTHRGVEYTITRKLHSKGKREDKLWVEFDLLGTTYRNGAVISQVATDAEVSAALGGLNMWAQSIINDHVSE